jgi:hypothetical protein
MLVVNRNKLQIFVFDCIHFTTNRLSCQMSFVIESTAKDHV